MSFVSCLNDHSEVVVLDASVVVNLNATGCAMRLIDACSNPFRVTQQVLRELRLGQVQGYSDAAQLEALIDQSAVELVTLSDSAEAVYLQLVSGHTADTLGDGEAATLAYANQTGHWAGIDERKATRICNERFSSLRLATTVDLLANAEIIASLSQTALSDAVFNTLQRARMRVLPDQVEWVVGRVGNERAKSCSSIPNRYRMQL